MFFPTKLCVIVALNMYIYICVCVRVMWKMYLHFSSIHHLFKGGINLIKCSKSNLVQGTLSDRHLPSFCVTLFARLSSPICCPYETFWPPDRVKTHGDL